MHPYALPMHPFIYIHAPNNYNKFMRRKNIITILIALAFLPALTHAKDGFEISIKIKGYKNQKLLLGNYFGDKQYVKDSGITDATGKIIFKGKEKLQGGIYLIATADKRLLFDFVVTEQHFSVETDSADFQANMKAIGSPENDVFFALSLIHI